MTDNEIIARFMGIQVYQSHEEMMSVPLENLREWAFSEDIDYHTNWSNLMPVVEKIENLGYVTVMNGCIESQEFWINQDATEMIVASGWYKSKIEGCYKAVVTFIKWYNSQNP